MEHEPNQKKHPFGYTNKSVESRSNRAFSIGWACALFALLFMVMSGTGLLYGQGAGDALFIDPHGNVGIRTSAPQATLDVAGKLNVSDSATIKESLTAGTLSVTKNANLADTTVKGSLKTTGNGVIGNAFLGDVGHGPTWAGFSHSESPSTTGYGFMHHNSGQYALINKKSGSGFIGLRIDNVDKMVVADNGNVGIGTTDPKATLDIKGNAMVSGTINGEDPPMKFTVGNPREQTKWLAEEKDLRDYCGDQDGCRIRLLMQHEINDEVRTISEEIYIEQPQISNNKEPGLRGWTRQSGGGDFGWILDWPGHLYDLFYPWSWFWAKNYRHENAYGTRGPAYTGTDRYKISFMSHPHVTTTVIIYDR
jgi:hypothetical protein